MTAVYIHIPYCLKKCSYCDFCSVPLEDSAQAYPDALIREIELSKDKFLTGSEISTIFFGGGTPTVLPAAALCRILEAVKRCYTVLPNAEISLECNPKTATATAFLQLRQAGFNRLSIGLQSADDELLRVVGRVHTYQDFCDTLRMAREAGFTNINVDVMHGLPQQTKEQYLDTLVKVADFDPTHISAYSLILEEDTPLKKQVAYHELTLPDPDEVADMQDAGIDYLESRGYRRYEVSNFAKEGYACRHNLTYWNNEPYVGFGVAAHSSMPDRKNECWLRWSNTESIKTYLRKLQRGKLPTEETLTLYASEEMFECIMLGLRKTEGLDRAAFKERFGIAVEDAYRNAILEAAQYDWWEPSETHLKLNRHGMDMLNSVLVCFR